MATKKRRGTKRRAAPKRKLPKKVRYRQTGSSNKRRDKQVKAKPPGKRKSASGKVYYERRKNRSDVPGTLAGIKSAAKKMLTEQLGKKLVKQSLATRKRDRRKFGKEATAIKRQIRKFE